jgi:cytochrome oxidase assembly protein ShyY1
VIFLLVNLGVVPIRDLAHLLATWWPLILIAIGVWQLSRPRSKE